MDYIEHHLGIGRGERRKLGQQHRHRGGFRDGKTKPADRPIPRGANLVERPVDLLERWRERLQQRGPRGGRRHALGGAGEELQFQPAFQAADRMTQGRLGDPEPRRSPGKAPLGGDDGEGREVVQFVLHEIGS